MVANDLATQGANILPMASQMHLQENVCIFIHISLEFFVIQLPVYGSSDNGLGPIRQQAIIWNKYDLVYRIGVRH